MENRVRNFILDKAVGLLRSFKCTTLPETFGDIESGLLDVSDLLPTDDRSQYRPGYASSRTNLGVLGGKNTGGTTSPFDARIQQGVSQHPQSAVSASEGFNEQIINRQWQYTEGAARFITANDGSKDCIALLVTDTLITRLRDLYEDIHYLMREEGPPDYARREAWELKILIRKINELIEAAENQEKVAELKEMVQQHEFSMHKIQQWRDELEDGIGDFETRVTSSRCYIQGVLHSAMEDADLLEPHRPLTPINTIHVESEPRTSKESHHDINHGVHHAVDILTDCVEDSAQRSVSLTVTDDTPKELKLLRQDACESYNEALVTMHKVQELFDDRQPSYETDLADYQQRFANGTYKISRSEFDRSKIRYGQKVTQALINAEAAFEAAKEKAQAVGAHGSEYEDETSDYGCYEESWPEIQSASHLATEDWNHVSKWLARVPEPGKAEAPNRKMEPEIENPEVTDRYAEELDPADSISQIDFDEYRKDIDRWENIRFDRWEDMRTHIGGPEVQVGFLVRSIESMKRRHSTSMCHPEAREWEPNYIGRAICQF